MPTNNDCQVLYIGKNQETYRGVNQALRSEGLSVMWTQDLESAEMLARTTNLAVMVCDAEMETGSHRLFRPGTIRPGTSCIEMALPKPDPRGDHFDTNISRTLRLLRVVRSLPGLQTGAVTLS